MSKYLDSNGLIYLWSKIKSHLDKKVDAVSGKVLSDNNYSNDDRDKLAGLKNYENATKDTDGLMSSTDKTKLDGIDPEANKYVLPEATNEVLGGIKGGSGVTITSGVLSVDAMKGASSSSNGSGGTVPAPTTTQADSFLRGDGTWAKPEGTTYEDATSTVHGLMSTADKNKLDAFGQASDYALKTDITGLYNYQGSVTNYTDLSLKEATAKKGDVWDVVNEGGMNYAWTGTSWDALGAVFTIEAITNTEIDAVVNA